MLTPPDGEDGLPCEGAEPNDRTNTMSSIVEVQTEASEECLCFPDRIAYFHIFSFGL